MDYSGFSNFPFPLSLTNEEETAKEYFLALSDETQLALLDGCHSYKEFQERLNQEMECE